MSEFLDMSIEGLTIDQIASVQRLALLAEEQLLDMMKRGASRERIEVYVDQCDALHKKCTVVLQNNQED